MGTFTSSDATSRPAVAISTGGLNANYASFLFASTASASQNIVLMPMPAGARITYGALSMQGAISAGVSVRIIDSLNLDVYLASASAAPGDFKTFAPAPSVLAKRLTASANLIAVINGGADAASSGASLNFKLVVHYLSSDTGD
jgi:hypothetical protein